MNLKELKALDKRVKRLREQIKHLQAAAYCTTSSFSASAHGKGTIPDKVGMNAAKIADLTVELDKLTKERNAALNSLSYEVDAANCIYLHVACGYSWQQIADLVDRDTADAVKAMCKRYKWTVKNSPS